MTRPQGDNLIFGQQAEEAPNLLFQELEMVQPHFYPENSASVQSELSQEVIDLQKILDFTSSGVNLMDHQFNDFKQPTGRGRNSSISSNGQPTGKYICRLGIKAILGFYSYWLYSQIYLALCFSQ